MGRSIDSYVFTIIKTADATFTVLASQTTDCIMPLLSTIFAGSDTKGWQIPAVAV